MKIWIPIIGLSYAWKDIMKLKNDTTRLLFSGYQALCILVLVFVVIILCIVGVK